MTGNAIERRTGAVAVPAQERSNLVRRVMAPFEPTFQALHKLQPFFDRLPVRELADDDIAGARTRVRLLPSLQELGSAVEAFGQAAFGETEEPLARALIGLMLDGLPSAKTLPSATYSDALIDSLLNDEPDNGAQGFPPVVLAAAVRSVWRLHVFAPAIAEFLTIARTERRRFRHAANWTETLSRHRCDAEGILIAAGEMPDPDGMDDSVPF